MGRPVTQEDWMELLDQVRGAILQQIELKQKLKEAKEFFLKNRSEANAQSLLQYVWSTFNGMQQNHEWMLENLRGVPTTLLPVYFQEDHFGRIVLSMTKILDLLKQYIPGYYRQIESARTTISAYDQMRTRLIHTRTFTPMRRSRSEETNINVNLTQSPTSVVRALKAYETVKGTKPNPRPRVTFSEEELRRDVNRVLQQDQQLEHQEEAIGGVSTGVGVANQRASATQSGNIVPNSQTTVEPTAPSMKELATNQSNDNTQHANEKDANEIIDLETYEDQLRNQDEGVDTIQKALNLAKTNAQNLSQNAQNPFRNSRNEEQLNRVLNEFDIEHQLNQSRGLSGVEIASTPINFDVSQRVQGQIGFTPQPMYTTTYEDVYNVNRRQQNGQQHIKTFNDIPQMHQTGAIRKYSNGGGTQTITQTQAPKTIKIKLKSPSQNGQETVQKDNEGSNRKIKRAKTPEPKQTSKKSPVKPKSKSRDNDPDDPDDSNNGNGNRDKKDKKPRKNDNNDSNENSRNPNNNTREEGPGGNPDPDDDPDDDPEDDPENDSEESEDEEEDESHDESDNPEEGRNRPQRAREQTQMERLVSELINSNNLTREQMNMNINNGPQNYANIKSPLIDLKKFGGEVLEYRAFKYQFQQAVNRTRLSDLEKLILLKQKLYKDALREVMALEDSNANYLEAWNILDANFLNERMLVEELFTPLFKLKTISENNYIDELKHVLSIYTTIEANERSIGITDHKLLYQLVLIQLVFHKLPGNLRGKMVERLPDERMNFTYENFKMYLKKEIARKLNELNIKKTSSLESGNKDEQKKKANNNKPGKISTFLSNENSTVQNKKCLLCQKNNHYTQDCLLLSKSRERTKLLKKNYLCVYCSRHKWSADKKCSKLGQLKCNICFGGHDTKCHDPTIHRNKSQQVNTNIAVNDISSTKLPTALVNLINTKSEARIEVKAIIDNCSQASYITNQVAKNLQLKRSKVHVEVLGLQGTTTGVVTEKVTIEILLRNQKVLSFDALVIDKIGHEPSQSPKLPLFITKKYDLANPNCHLATPCQLMIAADVLPKVMKARTYFESGYLLQDSHLGVLVSGPSQKQSKLTFFSKINTMITSTSILAAEALNEFQERLMRFWDLQFDTTAEREEAEEEYCEKLFREKAHFNEKGEVVCPIPWKNDPCPEIGSTYHICLANFLSNEKKWKKK